MLEPLSMQTITSSKHCRQFIVLLFILLIPIICACRDADADNFRLDPQLEPAAQLLRKNSWQQALSSIEAASPSPAASLMSGFACMKLKKYDEAMPYLLDAQQNLPQLADIASAMQAEIYFQLQRYDEAFAVANKAAEIATLDSRKRKMQKLAADALYAAEKPADALSAYRAFISNYTTGNDYTDALLQTARCLLALDKQDEAVQILRTIRLEYPASAQSNPAFKLLKELAAKTGSKYAEFTLQQEYERGLLLLANNKLSAAAWCFSEIQQDGISEEFSTRIDLAAGKTALRLRRYALAEPLLKRASGSKENTVNEEARLLLALVELRQGKAEKALSSYLDVAEKSKKHGAEALLGAAFIHKNSGRFTDAAQLFEQLLQRYPLSAQADRAGWELGWTEYLAGNLDDAKKWFNILLTGKKHQEAALYWLARINEKQDNPEKSAQLYNQLVQEYPFGFYAAWYRQKNQVLPPWQLQTAETVSSPLFPPGSERVKLLADLGMLELARAELAPLKTKGVLDDSEMTGLSRLQQLTADLHGSIVTFHRNRPKTLENSNISFWMLGYPRLYADIFSNYSAEYNLSEATVLALAKAESSFRADVKSHAGAIGLMQLMPDTARITAGYKKSQHYNPLRLIDPEHNISLGTKHLRQLLDRYDNNIVYSLAAYNAGGGAVNRWLNNFKGLELDEFIENIPYQETRNYVKKIIASVAVYQALYKIE